MNHPWKFLTCAFVALSAACSKDASTASGSGSPAIPESFHLSAKPADAKPVAEALTGAKGDAVVSLTGRVGGAEKVFLDSSAVFTLVDPKLVPCGEDGMNCATPWDYCCADPDELRKHSVLVELVKDGDTLKRTARGFHGLDHLQTVTAVGVLSKDAQGNASLKASGLYIQPR